MPVQVLTTSAVNIGEMHKFEATLLIIIVSANPQDSAGCNGGNAADAWHYFHVHGLSSMSGDGNNGCNPYVSGKCLLKVCPYFK